MTSHKWAGRRIVNRSHIDDLEREAAIHEFKDGLSRQEAEDKAYQSYRSKHHAEAGAHHLRGLRAAEASGDLDEARKHGIAYELHLRALGHEPGDPVPAEVLAHVQEPRGVQHKFKAHSGDSLLLNDDQSLEKADVLDFDAAKQKRDEAKAAAGKAHVQGVLQQAHDIMASDPGFQEAARAREVAGKEAKLKAGPQLFKPGQKVLHSDPESIPWTGTVTNAQYRDNDIDGPGHYYEVKWWNPKLKQHHEDYVHQDLLKPTI